MRRFFLSLLLVVIILASVVSASWPSAAQNKQLSNFEVQILAEHNNVRQKYSVQPRAVARPGARMARRIFWSAITVRPVTMKDRVTSLHR